MPRSSLTLTFPGFTGFVRRIVLANIIVFFALAILGIAAPTAAFVAFAHLALTPALLLRGEIWQPLTYSFLHTGLFDILFSMLSLWFIGSFLETSRGSRWTAELYFASVLGTALTALALSLTRLAWFNPHFALAGSAGGVFGLFIGFATLFGEMEIFLFPLPVRIRAKYLAVIYVLLACAMSLRGDAANLAHLGGALTGWLYARLAPARGIAFRASEWYFGLRNAWYRRKRRRAARKFEVYMGKQGREMHFDKEGRYIDPDKDKDRWIN
jgi:membrane associated rhomboid family serine protease